MAPKWHKKLDLTASLSLLTRMIRQFITLYRARNDATLAKQVASEMVVDGVIDRAGWPLGIVKFWMGVGIAVTSLLIMVFLLIASFSHWSLAIPVLPLGGIAYGIIRIWRGVNAGVERVIQLAKIELARRTENFQMPRFGKTTSTDSHNQA